MFTDFFIFLFLILLFLVIPSLSFAEDSLIYIASCFNQAATLYNLNPDLLWAIAKVESNFNQKAVNYNSNKSYDVGIMQINSFWKKYLGDYLWEHVKHDTCYNIYVGAWILDQCIKRYSYTWEAIGCYNASSSKKRIKYAHLVKKVVDKYVAGVK